jgi:DNA mismatch repair protein MutL
LRTISTLGFRGEALPSIASVAQVRAVSRTRDSTEANLIEIDCGDKSSIGPCGGDYGTMIQVRDLFYKLPARRKFLKTANTEMSHISEQFTRIALANKALDLILIHNGRELHRLTGSQGLHHRIAELFPSDISENLIETETNEKETHILALLGQPGASRTSNKSQYVFLNGRFIRDKFISHAVKEAYRGNLEPDRFPVVFLFIEMPYEDYDVNVHPTKIEVRFYNVNLVHSQVLGCLREKLLRTDLQAHGKLPTTGAKRKEPEEQGNIGVAAYRRQEITDAMAEFFRRHKPVQTQQRLPPTSKPYSGKQHLPAEQPAQGQAEHVTAQTSATERKFLQVHDSFIVEQTDDGFVIIDQHALHERILYENLQRRIRKSKLESQRLLIPESFELTEGQAEVVRTNAKLIEKLGVELVPFGPKTMAIQAFPTLLARAAPVDFVRDLIDLLADKHISPDPERTLDEILNMAACKAAIKAGQKLSDSEIEQLLTDRQRTEHASRCPHGRPTTIKFSLADLEKQFKRT